MPESIDYTSTGFTLESVSQPAPAQILVRFTYAPLQVSGSGANDGLNVNNYMLTGPGPIAITGVSPSGHDIQALILTLSAPLGTGTWTLTASTNIQTPTAVPLSPPNTATITAVAPVPAPAPNPPGILNTAPEDFLRQFLNPALQGDAWTAIIAALGSGDATNWNNADYAFDQLFITSASDIFLDRKLADDGIRRPVGIGLGDQPFRQLGISVRNKQLTQDAILHVLEIFYGTDAVRSYVETAGTSPFLLNDGDDLQLLIDGVDAIPVTFSSSAFTLIGQAQAQEVAVVITQAIQAQGSKAFAVAVTNPQTGLSTVRVYSGSIGLRSSVMVTGGKAQTSLLFPAQLPLPVTGTDPMTLTWNITIPSPNTMRLALTAGALSLLSVHPGDYVNVFGQNFQLQNRGSFPILDVFVAYSGSTLIQYVDVQNFNISPQTGVTEATLDDVRFYRPEKASIQQASGRTVVVNQSTDDVCNVIIPATTSAVTRMIDTGAYLHVAPALPNANAPNAYLLNRDATGLVTVAAINHGLSLGSQIYVDNVMPSLTPQVVVVPGTPGGYGGTGTTDASPLSQMSFIRPGDQVFSSQHQTAGLLTNTSNLLVNQPQVAIQVGGHAINNNLEFMQSSVGIPSIYSYTAKSPGLVPSQALIPLTVRLFYFGADGLFAIDDGAGNLVPVANINGMVLAPGGTVNYQTGAIHFSTLAEGQGSQALDLLYFSDGGTTTIVEQFTLLPPPSVQFNGVFNCLQWSYQYSSGGTYPHPVERHAMVIPPADNNLNGAVTFGGLSLSSGVATFYADVRSYFSGWGSTGVTLSHARSSLGAAILSSSGQTVVAGGASAVNTPALTTVDILDVTQSVLLPSPPQLLSGRAEAETVPFTDAQGNSWVMVIGGRYLAQAAVLDPLALALWHLDTIVYTGSSPETHGPFPGLGPGHTYTGTLSPAPVVPGSAVLKTTPGGVTLATDNGSGGWTGGSVTAGSINYTTGAYSITLSSDETSTNLEITYTYVGTGTTPDSTSNAYTLTLFGGTPPTAYPNGKISAAMNFSAGNGDLRGAGSMTAVTTLLGPFTIEAWVADIQNGTPGTGQCILCYEGSPVGSSATNSLVNFQITYQGGGQASMSFYWQDGSGSVAASGSSGSVPYDTTVLWHHVAMTKSLHPGSSTTFDVQFYLDGEPVGPLLNGSGSGLTNATGGGSSEWGIGSSLQFSFYQFFGQIDDVRVSGANAAPFLSTLPYGGTRQPSDIYLTWLRGRGDLLTAGNGQLHDGTEGLKQGASAWAKTGRMSYARSGHRATLLPDGRILVTGGYAYKAGNFFVPQSALGVAPPTATAEVYDPRTGAWTPAGTMAFPRAQHMAVYLPSSGLVMVLGGYGDAFGRTAGLFIEYWNPATGQWTLGPVPVPNKATLGSFPAEQFTPVLSSCRAVLMNSQDVVWIAGGLGEAGNGASYGEQVLIGDGSTTFFVYFTLEQPLLPGMVNITDTNGGNFMDDGAYPTGNISGTSYGIAWTGTVSYLNGEISITWASAPPVNAVLDVNYNTGNAEKGFIFVGASDQQSGGGLTGWQTVSNVVDSNHFQYETPNYPYLMQNASANVVITPFAAPPAGKVPGPYVWDTTGETPGITSVQAENAQMLFAGQQYEQLFISGAATSIFPNKKGFLALNFGGSDAVFPVPYLGVFSAASLSLDYTFVFPFDVPQGASVTLLATNGAFVPPVPEAVGSFYLTDSNAGRIAAEGVVENISGGGLNVDIGIAYPGDRGLGGEGLPATGQKFSDKVLVWGSNSLDTDEQDARLGINLQVED